MIINGRRQLGPPRQGLRFAFLLSIVCSPMAFSLVACSEAVRHQVSSRSAIAPDNTRVATMILSSTAAVEAGEMESLDFVFSDRATVPGFLGVSCQQALLDQIMALNPEKILLVTEKNVERYHSDYFKPLIDTGIVEKKVLPAGDEVLCNNPHHSRFPSVYPSPTFASHIALFSPLHLIPHLSPFISRLSLPTFHVCVYLRSRTYLSYLFLPPPQWLFTLCSVLLDMCDPSMSLTACMLRLSLGITCTSSSAGILPSMRRKIRCARTLMTPTLREKEHLPMGWARRVVMRVLTSATLILSSR